MKREVSRRARAGISRTGGGASWTVCIIAAIALVIAWNPYHHGTHHWFAMLIILIIALPLAGLLERRHKGKRVR